MIYRSTHTRNGYILPLTLFILGGLMSIVTYLFIRSSIFSPVTRTALAQEKARLAAYAGIEMARSLLAQPIEKEKEESQMGMERKPPAAPTQDERAAIFLKRLLGIINRWQTFVLPRQKNEEQASVTWCIVAEQGKIDINTLFDFKKKAFLGAGAARGDTRKALQYVFDRVQKQIGGSNMLEGLENYLKARKKPIDDVTELLMIKEFEPFKNYLFYEPQQAKDTKGAVYLTDIFTVDSNSRTVEPWLLSESIAHILELKSAQATSREQRLKLAQEVLKDFKRSAQWAQDWNKRLAPLYGKELQSLPKDIESMFNTPFEPKTFAIFSYGTVQEVTQRLLAIVEWTESVDKKKTANDVIVKKLYWL